SRVVALVAGTADDRLAARADARLADIAARTRVPVVACSAIGFRRTGADTRRWIAHSRLVALVAGAADDRLAARADARLAGIVAPPRVPVVACSATGFRRTGALPRRRTTHSRVVALVAGAADDRLAARADARLAGIAARTRVPVVAGSAVALHRAGTCTRGRVADARLAALVAGAADDRLAAGADARLARVAPRARIAIVARCSVALHRAGAD